MTLIVAALKAAWHYEPVLIGALPAILGTIGFTTAAANSASQAVSGALAALVQLVLALAARRKVKPTKAAQ